MALAGMGPVRGGVVDQAPGLMEGREVTADLGNDVTPVWMIIFKHGVFRA